MNKDNLKARKPAVPSEKYLGVLIGVSKNKALYELLRLICAIAVLYSIFLFGVTLATKSLVEAIELAALAAIPFVIVTLVRRAVNAPRPYELFSEIYDTPPKHKKGLSFPSRHVFSAFLVATVAMPSSPILASVALLLGACLAASRVLLGIHFIRDVVAGALLGLLSGAIAILVLFLI